MPIVVAGGIYEERCLVPGHSALFGSGGRAAAALSRLSPGVVLHAFHPSRLRRDAELAFAAFDVEVHVHDSSGVIRFEYLHPLSSPRISPVPLPTACTAEVSGDVVLRFGCLEGGFRVTGRRVVYDPQSGSAPEPFADNGSSAEELAIVLNRVELARLTGSDDVRAAADHLRATAGAAVVTVKMGAAGAMVCTATGDPHYVPAYRSAAVDKIGSGDVFSAVFTHLWGEAGVPPVQAADAASRYVAKYVEDRELPLGTAPPQLAAMPHATRRARVYLGGPFFTTPQIWLVEEARSGLHALGAEVFSPLHDVGTGTPETVARLDLDGLDGCSVMLALLAEADPGTLFEVGHARARGIPVVAFMQASKEQDATMLSGTDCEIVSDFATALYRAVWAGGG